jgi:phosphomannomutase/phosphoglucomutase
VSIYKTAEICGDSATELNCDLYRRWGLGLGLKLKPQSKFVLGGDMRESTPKFLAALRDGLCQAGLDVVELGHLPTPMIYYAQHRLHAAGCAIVTASVNRADTNGLKWIIGDRPPLPDDVQTLQAAAEDEPPKNLDRARSKPRRLDISFDYVANLQETWVEAMGAELHIVLDCMHGCWSGKARRYFHAIFPPCLITAIHDTPDAALAGQLSEGFQPHQLHELGDAVYRERAHLGIAFDGDGDCLALVDNQGMALSADETAWMLMETLGREMRGERFVCNQKFSDRVPRRAKELGAEAIVERSGSESIRARMMESNALFGAETSGHYFFRALEGRDDSLYAACRMIAFLAQGDKTLAQWRRECPAIYITPELPVDMPAQAQARIVEKLRRKWSSFPQQTLDGLRIDTPAGWALVSGSLSDSALSFRFEALDWSALDHLVRQFCDTLGKVGDELWHSYTSAMGVEGNRE